MIFASEEKINLPTDLDPQGRMQELAKRYFELSETEKQKYRDQAELEKQNFESEKK